MPLELERLSADEILALPRNTTAFFFPVSPLEDHGSHLPLNTHLVQTRLLTRRLAEKVEAELPGWRSVIFPELCVGVDTNTTFFSFPVRGYVLRDYLIDSAERLSRHGFKYFVCTSGHTGPKHLTAIEDASRMLQRKNAFRFLAKALGKPMPVLISASSALVDPKEALRSPHSPDPAEHGGELSTSMILLRDSDLLKKELSTLEPVRRKTPRLNRLWERRRNRLRGYWGNPASARSETAEEVLKDQVNEVFIKLRAVVDGGKTRHHFKSWYSVFPANKTLFRAWILSVGLFFLMVLWIFATFPRL